MSVRIGSIVMHCSEFERTVTFWQHALHYVPREPARNGWVVLRDPDGKGPNLSFQARERRPERRSWVHLDLYTNDRGSEVDFVVLEDPAGNLFCVVEVPA